MIQDSKTLSFKSLPIIATVLFAVGIFGLGKAILLDSSWFQTAFHFGTGSSVSSMMQSFFTPKPEPPTNVRISSLFTTGQSEQAQVINVVKNDSPAVVSILASSQVPKMEQCYENSPYNDQLPPELRGIFDVPNMCQNGTELQRTGAGSGFLVSSDGYIMTNRHVVQDEKAEYTVVLNDDAHLGQKKSAIVVARDPVNDVAILKIDMTGLPYLGFGDSNNLEVGQTAIAIGYALGQFDNTVSKGVISGLSRSITAGGLLEGGSEKLRGLIQTDAAINPGNSGGPLLDLAGNVIGMNVAVAEAQGIGFAIPGNVAKQDYDQVRANGKITLPDKAFLGVRYQPVTPEMKSISKLPYDYGMLIGHGATTNEVAVVPGSPADKAGLVENDIILEAEGKELNERYVLADALANKKPGDTVELKVYHKGQVKTMAVVLGKSP